MVKIEVSTHSGDIDVLNVDKYNVNELEEKRNSEVEAIAIGDNIYSRIDLKNIKVIKSK